MDKVIDTNFSIVKYSGEGKIDSLDGSSIWGQLVKLKIEKSVQKLISLISVCNNFPNFKAFH